jgi:hypothetical protein
MKKQFAIVMAGIGLLLLARSLGATVLLPTDLKDLSKSAYAIVHGRVVSVQPQWSEDARRIESLVSISAIDYLKGDLGATVTVRVPGGELGRYRSVMVGAPTFREGDEVVLFLGTRPPAMPYLLGLGQGVYRLTRETPTSEPLVSPSPIAPGVTPIGPIVRGQPSRTPVPYREFVRQVQLVSAAAAAPAGRSAPSAAAASGAHAVPRVAPKTPARIR